MRVRFISSLLVLVTLIGCHKNEPAPQEPAGPLESTWKSLTMEATEYDQQGKVLTAYSPTDVGFEKLIIDATNFGYVHEFPGVPTSTNWVAYTRAGNEITFPSQSESFTIKKLTLTKLDLLLVQKPRQSGNSITHDELLFHFERQ